MQSVSQKIEAAVRRLNSLAWLCSLLPNPSCFLHFFARCQFCFFSPTADFVQSSMVPVYASSAITSDSELHETAYVAGTSFFLFVISPLNGEIITCVYFLQTLIHPDLHAHCLDAICFNFSASFGHSAFNSN